MSEIFGLGGRGVEESLNNEQKSGWAVRSWEKGWGWWVVGVGMEGPLWGPVRYRASGEAGWRARHREVHIFYFFVCKKGLVKKNI